MFKRMVRIGDGHKSLVLLGEKVVLTPRNVSSPLEWSSAGEAEAGFAIRMRTYRWLTAFWCG